MKTNELDRRQFLRSAALSGAGALIASTSKLMAGYSKPAPPTDEKKLIKRKLGSTGIELPIVSMGVMRADNAALIPAAMKTGIVHFDTAHGYQGGKNEEMLGEVFKDYPRNSFIIATKVPPEEVDNVTGLLKPGSTSKAFLEKLDLSLKRLRLEYVDILYVHGISTRDAALFPAIIEAVREAKKSGRAKHIGMSTHKNQPEVIQAAIDSGIYEVVLTALNFRQDNYQEMKRVIAKAADAGIGIIAMKTMAGGYLDKDRKKPINCKAALKFVLQDEHVTTAIPGITNFDQLADNASVNADVSMTNEERADLAAGKDVGGLYCPGCDRCVSNCTKALPIPEIMRAYMYSYGYRDIEMAHSLLSSLDLPPHPCTDCGKCTVQCAKGFPVSERVKDITRLLDVPSEFLS